MNKTNRIERVHHKQTTLHKHRAALIWFHFHATLSCEIEHRQRRKLEANFTFAFVFNENYLKNELNREFSHGGKTRERVHVAKLVKRSRLKTINLYWSYANMLTRREENGLEKSAKWESRKWVAALSHFWYMLELSLSYWHFRATERKIIQLWQSADQVKCSLLADGFGVNGELEIGKEIVLCEVVA